VVNVAVKAGDVLHCAVKALVPSLGYKAAQVGGSTVFED
jgi:hypothetical protein